MRPMIVYFDAIRRAGSVREAARRLNVASSAVNRQLLKLEAELGTPLVRTPSRRTETNSRRRGIRTPCLRVLQDAERVRSELEALQGLRTGHIEIAAVEALVSELTGLARRVPLALPTHYRWGQCDGFFSHTWGADRGE
jgi:DNA-binding transcriptional LysR family regulator